MQTNRTDSYVPPVSSTSTSIVGPEATTSETSVQTVALPMLKLRSAEGSNRRRSIKLTDDAMFSEMDKLHKQHDIDTTALQKATTLITTQATEIDLLKAKVLLLENQNKSLKLSHRQSQRNSQRLEVNQKNEIKALVEKINSFADMLTELESKDWSEHTSNFGNAHLSPRSIEMSRLGWEKGGNTYFNGVPTHTWMIPLLTKIKNSKITNEQASSALANTSSNLRSN